MFKFLHFTAISLLLQAGGFAQNSTFPVIKSDRYEYRYPWAGGMNACQYNEIDIDRDGVRDLLVFDRIGNRLLPFINSGVPGMTDYTCKPEYISLFPEIRHWLILEDYDRDGRMDIFTYNPSNPGIIVYRNVSDTELKFERVVYPYLTSQYGSGHINILVTYADFPAITDIDNDGDLDILTFWALGSFVEYHKNQSMEKYGIPDSLDFKREEYCWGYFAENEESNEIYLDTCFGAKRPVTAPGMPSRNHRHTGSTFLVTDLDADGDKDLILGDVDYPNLIMLENGGTPEDAYMISQDPYFPSNTEKAWIFSMPSARMIDVNNDGYRDLLVSPFDPNPFVSENYRSSLLYLNSGENNQPVFNYTTKGFLQSNMIDLGSGNYPVFADLDQDGLIDIVAGNYGYYDSSWYGPGMFLHSEYTGRIAWFRNIGDANQPEFDFVTGDLAGVSSLHLTGIYAAPGDLDGDGHIDLVIGREDGKLMYYRNTGTGSPIPEFETVEGVVDAISVGQYSTPCLYDLNGNQLLDLVVGEKKGNLNYYENTGTSNAPEFTYVTDSLGKVNISDYTVSNDGYSTPCFFRDRDGRTRLLVGSEQGEIFLFTGITGNLQGEFTESDSLAELMQAAGFTMPRGYRTSATMGDLDGDTYPELVIGNFSGGFQYYPGIGKPAISGMDEETAEEAPFFTVSPNPVRGTLTLHFHHGEAIRAREIRVFSARGREVFLVNHPASNPIHIDLTGIPAGVYWVSVLGPEGKVGGRKVVKLND